MRRVFRPYSSMPETGRSSSCDVAAVVVESASAKRSLIGDQRVAALYALSYEKLPEWQINPCASFRNAALMRAVAETSSLYSPSIAPRFRRLRPCGPTARLCRLGTVERGQWSLGSPRVQSLYRNRQAQLGSDAGALCTRPEASILARQGGHGPGAR